MRELVYYVAVSLDGFIAAPDGSYDAFPVEGDHMAVALGEFGDALPAHVHAALGTTPPRTRFDTVIQGRASYDVARSVGIDRPYAHLDEYVATRSGQPAPDGVTFTADPVATVRELKAADGLDIYLCGGGALAGTLLAEIDRLVLKRNPVVLGAGVGLFGDTAAPAGARSWRAVGAREFDSGVRIEEYVAG